MLIAALLNIVEQPGEHVSHGMVKLKNCVGLGVLVEKVDQICLFQDHLAEVNIVARDIGQQP